MNNNPDSTPDLVFYSANLCNTIKDIELVTDLGSDHLAMMITLNLLIQPEATPERRTLQYDKCEIDKVSEDMSQFINTHRYTKMNETYISLFNKGLSASILRHTPVKRYHPFLHELPPFIIRMIKNKRKMYREYRRNPNPNFKTQLNEYNTAIHRMILQYRVHTWTKACNSINESKGKSFYQQVKKLSRYKKIHKIPTILANNKEHKTDEEKTKIFASHLNQSYQYDRDKKFDTVMEKQVDDWCDDYLSKKAKNDTPTKLDEDTYYELLHNSRNSSPGIDNIPWNIVKKLEHNIHSHIMELYEWCLNNYIFPQCWKTGSVILIPKGDKEQPRVENYRPITLLPVLGKLFEKIIKKKLEEHLDKHIPNHQFGFRKNRSTVHPLTILISNLQNAQLNKRKTAAVSIDIKKAFDSVWTKGLLYKLHKKNTPTYLIHIIKAYLENRKLRVKINNTFSECFTPMQGTPQGSPLSPLLFNIYCSDIGTTPNSRQYTLQYADDTLAISHEKTLKCCIEKIQLHIDDITAWLARWRLKVNPAKSKLIIFNHNIHENSPSISINNKKVKPSPSIKYLGIHLDNKASLKLHANIMKKKAITRAKQFKCLTYKDQGIDMKTATTIYKTICRPIIEYGHPLYANCKESLWKIIKSTETSSLRTITKLRNPRNRLHNPPNNLLYELTKIEPIRERIKKLNERFRKRLEDTEEVLGQFHHEPVGHLPRKFPTCSLLEKLRNQQV